MLRASSLTTAAITGGTAKFDDGAQATPSIAFASATGNGFYKASSTEIGVSIGGSLAFRIGNVALTLFADTGALVFGAAADTTLARGAAGVWKFASAGSFTANGAVATSLTGVGPTGASTTVQQWLTIQNSSGVTRYIPCF